MPCSTIPSEDVALGPVTADRSSFGVWGRLRWPGGVRGVGSWREPVGDEGVQQCAATALSVTDLTGPCLTAWPAQMTFIDLPATSSHPGGRWFDPVSVGHLRQQQTEATDVSRESCGRRRTRWKLARPGPCRRLAATGGPARPLAELGPGRRRTGLPHRGCGRSWMLPVQGAR